MRITPEPRLQGRGKVIKRNGRPRPIRYNPRVPHKRIYYFLGTTGLAIISGVASIATASITTPEGVSESLAKVTGSAASTNSFFDYSFPVATAPGGKYKALYIDLYVTRPTTSSSSGTLSSGCRFDFFLAVTAFGGANSIVCSTELAYGWQRIYLCKEDFSTINGTGNWDTSTFIGVRWKIYGTSGHTQSIWIREMGWV